MKSFNPFSDPTLSLPSLTALSNEELTKLRDEAIKELSVRQKIADRHRQHELDELAKKAGLTPAEYATLFS